MTNSIQQPLQAINNPFLFADHEIRTAIDDNGDPWFCAKDVFLALNITWSNRTGSLKNVPEKWISPLYLKGQSGSGEVLFLKEAALYMISFRSNKPDAVKFTEWVCEEVLPAIRRQGFFGTITAGQQIQLRNQMFKLLDKINITDAFVHAKLLASLRNICNQLGEPMPDVNLIGKDRHQLSLGV
jgi:prophage antirepressor-like protein